MNLPEKLIYLRKQNGFTQMDLAEKMNVSRQAISRWEVGTAAPSTDNLKELSNLYDVSLDYLLNDEPSNEKVNQVVEEIKADEHTGKVHKPMHLIIVALAMVLAIVSVICATVVHLQTTDEKTIVPMNEMICLEEDDYPTVVFTIE